MMFRTTEIWSLTGFDTICTHLYTSCARPAHDTCTRSVRAHVLRIIRTHVLCTICTDVLQTSCTCPDRDTKSTSAVTHRQIWKKNVKIFSSHLFLIHATAFEVQMSIGCTDSTIPYDGNLYVYCHEHKIANWSKMHPKLKGAYESFIWYSINLIHQWLMWDRSDLTAQRWLRECVVCMNAHSLPVWIRRVFAYLSDHFPSVCYVTEHDEAVHHGNVLCACVHPGNGKDVHNN